MKKIIITIAFFVVVVYIPASATIINIPDDYATIQAGINASSDGDTVLVQRGEYVENVEINTSDIVLSSLFISTGDTSDISNTIIKGNEYAPVVKINVVATLFGFTITSEENCSTYVGVLCQDCSNPVIKYNIIENLQMIFGMDGGWGMGIRINNSNPIIAHNIIRNNLIIGNGMAGHGEGCGICVINRAEPIIYGNIITDNFILGCGSEGSYGKGGGIFVSESSGGMFNNNIITYNVVDCITTETWESYSKGGGIYCGSASAIFINNVIYGNSVSADGGYYNVAQGGGFYGHAIVINSIIYSNDADEDSNVSGDPTITNSCIEYGWPGEGNIDTDPLFRDPESGDFHLMAIECGDTIDSPCIDAGHPDILDSLLDCAWGLGDSRSDIGTFGGGEGWVSIDELINIIPTTFALSQNYPNPFNAATTISYDLPQPGMVTLDIYDILGRKVQTLYNDNQPAGSHNLRWNADGFSSGVYFYKLTAGEYKQTHKMMLLK